LVTGFNHTSFTVIDMDKSVRFWTENLGFRAASVSPRTGRWQEEVTGIADATLMVAHLYGHGAHVEFIQYLNGALPGSIPQPAMPCAAHVCLEVDDIEATWSKLLAAGGTMQGQIAMVDAGPVKGLKAGYIRDPNGIIIELMEVRKA
jgi:catechol 2,3-dioxygenase-like lactoylglutathione lyase family enzyme